MPKNPERNPPRKPAKPFIFIVHERGDTQVFRRKDEVETIELDWESIGNAYHFRGELEAVNVALDDVGRLPPDFPGVPYELEHLRRRKAELEAEVAEENARLTDRFLDRVKTKAGECPFCDSENIQNINTDYSGITELVQFMRCDDCNGEWTKTFTITAATPLPEKHEENEDET
jgi:hypothetical protein